MTTYEDSSCPQCLTGECSLPPEKVTPKPVEQRWADPESDPAQDIREVAEAMREASTSQQV